jgi:predicted permease
MKIVFEQVVILFIIGLVGFVAAKLKVIVQEYNKLLVKFILKITLPLLIFTTFANTELSYKILHCLPYIVGTAFFSVLFLCGLGLCSAKLQRLDKENTALHCTSTMFGNIGFLGFPMLGALFGSEGLIYASIFQLSHDTLMWTLGLFILNNGAKKKSKESWRHIINAATVALLIGLIFFIFQIKLPNILFSPLHGIGHTTIYLSMIYMGAVLSTVKVKTILLNYRSYILCFNKLIFCPIIIIIIFKFLLQYFEISQSAIICAILEAAMPCMIIISVLASELGINSKQSVENIFISSVIALGTLPLIYYLTKLILF